jgi:hypothetical protein
VNLRKFFGGETDTFEVRNLIQERRFNSDTQALKNTLLWVIAQQKELSKEQHFDTLNKVVELIPDISLNIECDFNLLSTNSLEWSNAAYTTWKNSSSLNAKRILLYNGAMPQIVKISNENYIFIRFNEGNLIYYKQQSTIFINKNANIQKELETLAYNSDPPISMEDLYKIFRNAPQTDSQNKIDIPAGMDKTKAANILELTKEYTPEQIKEALVNLKQKPPSKEHQIAENQKLKDEKATLEQEIVELKKQLENATSEEEIENLTQLLLEKQGSLVNTTNEIDKIEKTITIRESDYNDISKEQQIQENYEAKRLVRERLEPEGFVFPDNYYEQYSAIDITKDGEEYPIVVKNYKYENVPFKIGANEWIHLMNDNAMFWVHFGGGKLGCIKLYELLKRQSNLSLSFSTENLEAFRFSEDDMQDLIKGNRKGVDVLAKLLHYFKDVHFDFSNLNKDRYTTTAQTMEDYRFNERKQEEDINDEEEPE